MVLNITLKFTGQSREQQLLHVCQRVKQISAPGFVVRLHPKYPSLKVNLDCPLDWLENTRKLAEHTTGYISEGSSKDHGHMRQPSKKRDLPWTWVASSSSLGRRWNKSRRWEHILSPSASQVPQSEQLSCHTLSY